MRVLIFRAVFGGLGIGIIHFRDFASRFFNGAVLITRGVSLSQFTIRALHNIH